MLQAIEQGNSASPKLRPERGWRFVRKSSEKGRRFRPREAYVCKLDVRKNVKPLVTQSQSYLTEGGELQTHRQEKTTEAGQPLPASSGGQGKAPRASSRKVQGLIYALKRSFLDARSSCLIAFPVLYLIICFILSP